MKSVIRYVELKTGYADNGPAWIARLGCSKSGSTFYFGDRILQKYNGISGNYRDVITGEEYWLSGVKKNGGDRHPAGRGKVAVDSGLVAEYLTIIGKSRIDPSRYSVQTPPVCQK